MCKTSDELNEELDQSIKNLKLRPFLSCPQHAEYQEEQEEYEDREDPIDLQ